MAALLGSTLETGTVIDMPQADREAIEKYLGRGVVGKAVEAKPIDDPGKFIVLDPDTRRTLVVRDVYGDNKGKTRKAHVKPLPRRDPPPAWTLSTGEETWYGELTAQGDFVQTATSDSDQGVISRFSPPQPLLLKGMKPGEARKSRIEVEVFDLARQSKKEHEGYLDLTYTYVGAYEVTVPAGKFEAVLFKWEYDGKVGPAKVKDDQYWFFAEGNGPVARIDKKDVSAFLIYRDKSKTATVLVERRTLNK
jgi:hypothetical protein